MSAEAIIYVQKNYFGAPAELVVEMPGDIGAFTHELTKKQLKSLRKDISATLEGLK